MLTLPDWFEPAVSGSAEPLSILTPPVAGFFPRAATGKVALRSGVLSESEPVDLRSLPALAVRRAPCQPGRDRARPGARLSISNRPPLSVVVRDTSRSSARTTTLMPSAAAPDSTRTLPFKPPRLLACGFLFFCPTHTHANNSANATTPPTLNLFITLTCFISTGLREAQTFPTAVHYTRRLRCCSLSGARVAPAVDATSARGCCPLSHVWRVAPSASYNAGR